MSKFWEFTLNSTKCEKLIQSYFNPDTIVFQLWYNSILTAIFICSAHMGSYGLKRAQTGSNRVFTCCLKCESLKPVCEFWITFLQSGLITILVFSLPLIFIFCVALWSHCSIIMKTLIQILLDFEYSNHIDIIWAVCHTSYCWNQL